MLLCGFFMLPSLLQAQDRDNSVFLPLVVNNGSAPNGEHLTTIFQTLAGDGNFTIITAALKASNLASTLDGAGNLTFFAPTDSAFRNLPEGAIDTLYANPRVMADILAFHIVTETLSIDELTDGLEIETLQGSPVTFSVNNGTVQIGEATMISPSVAATNGLIYSIDGVLAPAVDEPLMVLVEGDILLPVNTNRNQPLSASSRALWPTGIVPFEFDTTASIANVSPAHQAAALQAMQEWENVANVTFVQCVNNQCRGQQANYLHIQNSDENSSAVGMQGGQQVVNIFNWDWRFIIAHELAHALGMWHEQSRPDRDTYIHVNEQNIEDGEASQFAIHPRADVYPKAAYGLPGGKTYDFDSVMHYDRYAFSTCTPRDVSESRCSTALTTIDAKPEYAQWQNRIGQRDHLSKYDALTMSFMYPQANWRFVDKHAEFLQEGTFFNPYQSLEQARELANVVVWIQPGDYSGGSTLDQPMTLRAPLGYVEIGP